VGIAIAVSGCDILGKPYPIPPLSGQRRKKKVERVRDDFESYHSFATMFQSISECRQLSKPTSGSETRGSLRLFETVCRGQADKTLVGELDNIFGEILEGLKPHLPYSEWKKGAEVRLCRSVLGEKVSDAEVLEFSSQ
jgi:hypothetical protein